MKNKNRRIIIELIVVLVVLLVIIPLISTAISTNREEWFGYLRLQIRYINPAVILGFIAFQIWRWRKQRQS